MKCARILSLSVLTMALEKLRDSFKYMFCLCTTATY